MFSKTFIFLAFLGASLISLAQSDGGMSQNTLSKDTIYTSFIQYDRVQEKDSIYYLLTSQSKRSLDSLAKNDFIDKNLAIEIYSYHHPLTLREYSMTTLCRPILLNQAIENYLLEIGINQNRITVKNCKHYRYDHNGEHQSEVYFVVSPIEN